MDCNLEFYKAFYYTGLYKSMTKAADALFLTQPAVSASIRKLEEYLGCSLFIRSPHGLSFTDEGEILFRHTSAAFEEFNTAELEIRRLSEFRNGSLTIGVSETPLHFYLLPYIERFKKKYPGVHIAVNGHTTPELIRSLDQGNLDIAVILSRAKLPEQFNTTAVMTFQDIFVASPEFAATVPSPCTIHDISAFPLIALKENTDFHAGIEDVFKKNGSIFTPDCSVENTSMILPFVLCGLGVGIIPEVYASDGLKEGSLVKIEVTPELPSRTLYVATGRSLPPAGIAGQFLSFLKE